MGNEWIFHCRATDSGMENQSVPIGIFPLVFGQTINEWVPFFYPLELSR